MQTKPRQMSKAGNSLVRTDDETQIEVAIRSRRSVRRFTDRPVPEEVVRDILEAACWAPSPHNAQPWRFAVVSSVQSKTALARGMGTSFSLDLQADGLSQAEIDRLVTQSFARISTSPVVVLVCMVEKGLRSYPDARKELEREMAMQSIGAAIQNLLLSAHDHGLGACWMAAPLFCQDTVTKVLELDVSWQPQAMVLVGYPSVTPKAPCRLQIEECVIYR